MRLLAFTFLVAGCAFDRTGIARDGGDEPVGLDATITDGQRTCAEWIAPNIDPCDPGLPTPGMVTLTEGRSEYDTDTGVLTSPGGETSVPASAVVTQLEGPDVRVLSVVTLDVPQRSTLAVVGTRPLVIAVHGSANVDGVIDVAAGGDDATACAGMTGRPGTAASSATAGGGGGGGGAFGDNGGDGTDGNGGGHGNKGARGAKNNEPQLVPLRGGCGGGRGGDDSDAIINGGGAAGGGGGALEITVLGDLAVGGQIQAAGRGGGADTLSKAGGGGGGAGGAILLDAETIGLSATAAACANGGGGGEGGQLAQSASPGDPGGCTSNTAAAGGALGSDGGNGGTGGVNGATKGGKGGAATAGAGGGGGGGGVGRIRLHARESLVTDAGAIVSPPASN